MSASYFTVWERFTAWGLKGLAIIILTFLILPIIIIIPVSFNESDYFVYPFPGLSLKWYEDFYSDPKWLQTAANTLIVSVSATVVATTLGTLASVGLVLSKSRITTLITMLLISPMIVPLVIIGVAMFFFYSTLGIAGTYFGLVVAHSALGLPFVVITVTATLQKFNMNLLRAAQSLGASPLEAFRTVMMPLIAPGMITGGLFAFFISFDEVVVTLFLAAPEQRTLPLQIFAGIRQSISPTITAVAAQLIGIAFILMTIIEAVRRREEWLK